MYRWPRSGFEPGCTSGAERVIDANQGWSGASVCLTCSDGSSQLRNQAISSGGFSTDILRNSLQKKHQARAGTPEKPLG
jgi:hypothetical protein